MPDLGLSGAFFYVSLCLSLAGLIGFSAHRASICSVRAVGEILTTGRAYMLTSFGKTVLWSMSITLPLLWFTPDLMDFRTAWALNPLSLAGGFLFGIGAAINGGCAVSTLTQFCSGSLRMGTTILGFAIGLLFYSEVVLEGVLPQPVLAGHWLADHKTWVPYLFLPLLAWALFELVRLWRGRNHALSIRDHLLAPRYRLSSTALFLGVANGLLFFLVGGWAYTSALRREVGWQVGLIDGTTRPGFEWVLAASLLAGILISVWQSKRFNITWRPDRAWALHFTAGLMMGVGAGLMPGGNDTLLLGGMPIFALHAYITYGFLLAGIAATLTIKRQLFGTQNQNDCSGDICHAAP